MASRDFGRLLCINVFDRVEKVPDLEALGVGRCHRRVVDARAGTDDFRDAGDAGTVLGKS